VHFPLFIVVVVVIVSFHCTVSFETSCILPLYTKSTETTSTVEMKGQSSAESNTSVHDSGRVATNAL